MAARCGGYAVRPMVWPMLLHWDRQRVEPQQRNAHPTEDQRWKHESPRLQSRREVNEESLLGLVSPARFQ
jgi:hypothetical protein